MALAVALQIASGTGQPVIERGQKTLTVYFTITPSGNYATGGDTLDLTQLFSSSAGAPGLDVVTGSLPLQVYIQSQPTGGVSGWWYQYRPGTTLANGKMQVLGGSASSGTSHQEFAAGAYSGASPSIATDTIVACAIFPAL